MSKSRQLLPGLLLVLFLCVFTQVGIAAGNVNSCDEVSLNRALSGGGDVTITCTGTITLSRTIEILTNTRAAELGVAVLTCGGFSCFPA